MLKGGEIGYRGGSTDFGCSLYITCFREELLQIPCSACGNSVVMCANNRFAEALCPICGLLVIVAPGGSVFVV